jgi:hypothetical protein
MVHVPVVTMVILDPDVVHTLVVADEIETASPELAVGATENGVAENSFVPGFVNVIV